MILIINENINIYDLVDEIGNININEEIVQNRKILNDYFNERVYKRINRRYIDDEDEEEIWIVKRMRRGRRRRQFRRNYSFSNINIEDISNKPNYF